MACNTNQKFPDFKSDVRNLIRSTYRKLVFDLDEDLEENVETELCRVVEEYFKIDLIKEYNTAQPEQIRIFSQEKDVPSSCTPQSSVIIGDFICYDFYDDISQNTHILFYTNNELVCMRFDIIVNPFNEKVSIVYLA